MEKTKAEHIEDLIDETLDDSFPASDPPSFSPVAFQDPILRMKENVARVTETKKPMPWVWIVLGSAALIAFTWGAVLRVQKSK